MRVQQSGDLACVVLMSMGLVCRHLLSKAISEGRANVALYRFELLFKTFGIGGWVLILGLLEFEEAVPVCRNGDRGVLGANVLMDARFDGCEESQWVIPNSGLIVLYGDESCFETVGAAVVHNIGKGLGQVGVERLLLFDKGTHSGTEFNIHTWLEEGLLILSACSCGPGGFLGIQINELTCANGLGNVVAIVIVLLNVSGNLFMDSSTRGIVGGGCVHTKLHEWFLLGRSHCLLGAGVLVALAIVSVVADVASSTSA